MIDATPDEGFTLGDTTSSPFLRACRRQPVDRRPVWLMRQAGRYLPEYRALREEHSFLELCHTPDLAAEVTLQPLRRFDLDAAILFCDIMIPVEAMGVDLEFAPGPVIGTPVRSRADVDRLHVPDPEAELGFVGEAVRLACRALDGGVPLIGFAGAPFTLACYLVDGQGSKTFPRTRALAYADPDTFHALLDKLTRTVADFLTAQVAAGAGAVQVFDSWVGLLGEAEFSELLAPHLETLFGSLDREAAPLIYYVSGGPTLLSAAAALRPDVVSVDWRVGIDRARELLGPGIAVQGNLDPAALLGPPEEAARRARAVCERAGSTGHVFNLGHGLFPDTPVESVQAVVAAVHEAESTSGEGWAW